MKTFDEWALELPSSYRPYLTNIFPYSMVDVGFQSVMEFLSYVIGHIEEDDSKDASIWRNLAKRYIHEISTFHVAYWTEPNANLCVRSTGENVQALDLFHAVDIVRAKRNVSIDNIIYVHSKDSCYKDNRNAVA